MRIHRLASEVANQIAAGEVIERPASVVKELLENALDAHADTIHVDIGFGGLNHICISDNGDGIVADDLLLSIAPHATSKLRQLDELSQIGTMGFRGEALASISSVSQLSIQSRAKSEPCATRLDSGPGGVQLSACARNQGTTIEVRDLFYNTPVRKRFLKTEREEYLAIDAVVRRFAFTRPAIALSLAHNGKTSFSLPAAPTHDSMHLRLKKLLGKPFIEHAIFLSDKSSHMRLEGWISHPTFSKSQHDKQWIYINQRMVSDKLILNAIKQAYAAFLHPGRYPVCVLYLTIDPEALDVNVHPAKNEVRFHEPRVVHDFIRLSVASALGIVPETKRIPTPLMVNDSRLPAESSMRQALNWFVLNQSFAIAKHENASYLIDFSRLERYRMQKFIATQSTPWVSRPLLVPISFSLADEVQAHFAQWRLRFLDYGLQVDEVIEGASRVRGIPRCLPRLDLARFFEYLNNGLMQDEGLIEAFLQAQPLSLLTISEEEGAELLMYWQQFFPDIMTQGGIAMPLSLTHCQAILNG